MIRTYSDLILIPSFFERLKYLMINGSVGNETFGHDRYVNQLLYKSQDWKRVRSIVIDRDQGRDLGFPGREIFGRILIHHMNPITMDDIINRSDYVMNPEYLICVTHDTHNKIHYGIEPPEEYKERSQNDTKLW